MISQTSLILATSEWGPHLQHILWSYADMSLCRGKYMRFYVDLTPNFSSTALRKAFETIISYALPGARGFETTQLRHRRLFPYECKKLFFARQIPLQKNKTLKPLEIKPLLQKELH